MNRFASSILLIALVAVQGAFAFTTRPAVTTVATTASLSQKTHTKSLPYYSTQTTTSSSALNLKVKVDPEAKTKNAAGNAKAAAYGGSIVIAAALPVIFLVWSALSKGN